MAFFSQFNKQRIFDIDTAEFDYKNLETLFKENGEDQVYQLKAVYISTKSEFDPESPLAAIDGYYVNLPQHQLGEVKAMLESKKAIEAIKEGKAGFIIREFYQRRFKKYCYTAEWVDVNPADFDVED